ncbi:hypothetical protein U9M48_018763 [Paspalum notatum var. saurae]|uniref:Uncharacterized protein n=1 Tax=Paspalum notatum var. saurae TaxID=547442 RepID=A0AAQ3WQ04_PASNO
MVSKFTLIALVLFTAVGGELGHAVPLRHGLRVVSMKSIRGGAPCGMQPSDTKIFHAGVGEEGGIYRSAEEAKFVSPVPGFLRPPYIPPS